MRNFLVGIVALACVGALCVGCTPKADVPPLEDQASAAKKMPGADTPPAAINGDPNAAKRAKEEK